MVGFPVQVFVPARAFENDQKERPKGGHAGCNYYNVTFIAVSLLVS